MAFQLSEIRESEKKEKLTSFEMRRSCDQETFASDEVASLLFLVIDYKDSVGSGWIVEEAEKEIRRGSWNGSMVRSDGANNSKGLLGSHQDSGQSLVCEKREISLTCSS